MERAEPKAERVVTWQNLNNRRQGGRRKTSIIAGREAGAEPQQHRPIGRCKWGGCGGAVAPPVSFGADLQSVISTDLPLYAQNHDEAFFVRKTDRQFPGYMDGQGWNEMFRPSGNDGVGVDKAFVMSRFWK